RLQRGRIDRIDTYKYVRVLQVGTLKYLEKYLYS
ncbi:hypothetical protein L249_6021, partial [Ophiocordyceps polyrhachis-furcata BCC 54312]